MASIILIAANLVSISILFCYRKKGSTYKFNMSLLAHFLMSALAWQVIEAGMLHKPISWATAAISLILAYFVISVRGNVSSMLRYKLWIK